MAEKSEAKAPAKAAKSEKKEEVKSKAQSVIEARGPKKDPTGYFKIDVHSKDDNRATFVASVVVLTDKGENVKEELMTRSLNEALAFCENHVGTIR